MKQGWLGLEDHVVIVTGGASGIGKHVADALAAAGAKVAVVDMNVETGSTEDGKFCVQCNVADRSSVQAMTDAVVKEYGRIDALVNNAGINLPRSCGQLYQILGERTWQTQYPCTCLCPWHYGSHRSENRCLQRGAGLYERL